MTVMELNEDTHLCLRCGRTIEGLNNYVTHRQQLCQDSHQAHNSPFLSDTSVNLPSNESIAYEQSVSHQDLYKLSADDFFLSLNLQSNFKSTYSGSDLSCENTKVQNTTNESFCPRLDIPLLENDLGSTFSEDKALCPESIIDESDCLSIEKWENFKVQPQVFQTSDECSKDESDSNNNGKPKLFHMQLFNKANMLQSNPSKLKENKSTDSVATEKSMRKYKKKTIKKYGFTDFSVLQVPRTSYRQKLHANDSLMCCQGKQKYFLCLLCNVKFTFAFTFLEHLLVCKTKTCDTSKWEVEVFKNELLFVRSSHFRCLLCSFYSTDSFMFLNHLKTPSHRQNAASLKNPLICLPCQDECSASDEMREHFSKCHLQYRKGDHPIILAEKKRNLHCCFCLSLVKSSSHLESQGSIDELQEADIALIRESLPLISNCAFGVDKHMLNTCVSIMDPYVHSEDSVPAVSSTDVSFNESSDNLIVEIDTPVESSNLPEVKISKKHHSKSDENLNEYVISKIYSSENEQLPKLSLKRLVGKFSTKNAKLILKKCKKGNFKKIWSCNLCSRQYVSKLRIQRHLDVCVGEKQEDCDSPKSKQILSKSKCSSEIKKFLCHRCGYVGKSYNQLTRHSRSHSGERPFHCTHCTYSASLSSQMVRHRRLHTGLKPYKCPYCSYSCNTQENLRKHILKTKKHKGKMMYPCHHCDYESNDFADFKNHLLKLHSKQYPNGISCFTNKAS